MIANEKTRKIGLKNYLAYGAGDLYGGGAFFIVTTFSMFYLVNVIGMHPILAGLIPALGKVWDAISDPLMGYIADNTKENKYGKRRVWFLISILPIAVTFTLIWFPTSIASQMGKFFFYFFAYILFFTVATMSYIPYAALSAEMTYDRKERNLLNGSRIFFSFIATLIGGVAVQPIIDYYDGTKTGYLVMGIVFGLIFAIPWITLYFGTWEVPQPERKKDDVNFLRNFFSLFKSKTCRIHVAMYVCSYGTMDIFMAWVLFYFVDYLQMGSMFIVAQGALLISMMVALPFYVKMATTKGHAKAYMLGLSLFLVGMIGLIFLTPSMPLPLMIINVIILGCGLAAGSLIPHQLLPFTVDVDKLMSGKDRAGTYSAVMTLTRKLFLGLVILQGLGFLLTGIGYKTPVPTVLTEPQFAEAIELAEASETLDPMETTTFLNRAYGLREDGNFHLNHLSQNKEKVIVNAMPEEFVAPYAAIRSEGEVITEIPAAEFEAMTAVLDVTKPGQMRKKHYLTTVFTLNDGVYVYDETLETAGQLSDGEVYDLRVIYDEIGFKYTGIGNQRKIIQSASTLNQLKFFFILFPIIMCSLGIIIATRFKLSPKNHALVVAELQRLDAGGSKEDVDPETKEVCELVTGHAYETLYN